MNTTNESFYETIASLPLDAREAIACALDSVDVAQRQSIAARLRADIEQDRRNIEMAWADEAQRRLVAAERGEIEAIPAEDVFARLRPGEAKEA